MKLVFPVAESPTTHNFRYLVILLAIKFASKAERMIIKYLIKPYTSKLSLS